MTRCSALADLRQTNISTRTDRVCPHRPSPRGRRSPPRRRRHRRFRFGARQALRRLRRTVPTARTIEEMPARPADRSAAQRMPRSCNPMNPRTSTNCTRSESAPVPQPARRRRELPYAAEPLDSETSYQTAPRRKPPTRQPRPVPQISALDERDEDRRTACSTGSYASAERSNRAIRRTDLPDLGTRVGDPRPNALTPPA